MYIILIKTTFRDTYFFDTMHDSLQFSYICEQPFMFENKINKFIFSFIHFPFNGRVMYQMQM